MTGLRDKQTHTPDYCGRILAGEYSGALKNALQRHRAACQAFDAIGLPVMPYIAAWKIDTSGIWYEFVSERFLALFASTPEKLGQEFSRAVLDRRVYKHEDVYPDVRELVLARREIDDQRYLIRQESIQKGATEAVYKVLLPDNSVRWLKDWASVETFASDGICLSPGYLADVSMEMDRKDQVDELNIVVNRDKDLLVEAERHAALGQISAQVYHEIRNPILSIGGLAKRLAEQFPAGGPQSYMAVIVKEVERLENILHNLFKFTAAVELARAPIQPEGLLKRVIGLLRSDLDRYNIEVTLTFAADLPELMLDQEQIHEALVHILKNSIEAMPQGGHLEIGLGVENGNVAFRIRDSGTGISIAHASRVTEPFFTTKVYGSGLGLSLASKAVQLHGGKLEINMLASGGTEAVILLPIKSRE
ncbi:MAG: sensor histidine kinase [Desulfobulbaceae bacterium]